MREKGIDSPGSVRPGLYSWNLDVYEAFTVLSSGRPVTMGPEAISLCDIKAYVDLLGLREVDERLRWVKMLRALDRVFLRHARKKQDAEIKRRK